MNSRENIAEKPDVTELIRRALAEDVGTGDVTTLALVPPSATSRALVLARTACVVSGVDVAVEVFRQADPALRCTVLAPDGTEAAANAGLLRVEGPAGSILTGERTALNFMQRLTGIATLTRAFVRLAQPHGAAILDTRKTTPGLRVLEKYAVRCGGGVNHRTGLYDRVLIKDNHRRLWRDAAGGGGLDAAVRAARARFPGLVIEIEVETAAELEDALRGGPEWVLLDNMSPAAMAECVRICGGRAKTEASGGITLRNVEAVARSGVDAISLGCLTHSAPAADLSLEIE